MDIKLELSRDEVLYIIEQLEERKLSVSKSEMLDLDDIIRQLNTSLTRASNVTRIK